MRVIRTASTTLTAVTTLLVSLLPLLFTTTTIFIAPAAAQSLGPTNNYTLPLPSAADSNPIQLSPPLSYAFPGTLYTPRFDLYNLTDWTYPSAAVSCFPFPRSNPYVLSARHVRCPPLPLVIGRSGPTRFQAGFDIRPAIRATAVARARSTLLGPWPTPSLDQEAKGTPMCP